MYIYPLDIRRTFFFTGGMRWAIGLPLTLLGFAGVPEDVRLWWQMLMWLDWWFVRALLAVVGVAIITYPQWSNFLKEALDLHPDHTLWGGIQIRRGWNKAIQDERRKNKRR